MDPLEEFEFKPLTDGLGFHRKKVDLAQEMQKSGIIKNSLTKDIPPTPQAILDDNKLLKSPLPTKGTNPQINKANGNLSSSITPSTSISNKPSKDVIDELVQSFKTPKSTFEETTQKTFVIAPNKLQEVWVVGQWEMAPFLIDLMMVLAMFLFGLIVSLYVTRVDIYDYLFNPANGIEEFVAVPAILFSMIISYTLITRIFIGGTLGEKVFDLQLGSKEDIRKYSYALKVALRMFIVIATGFVFLPLMSMILSTDISGKITKLNLYKKTIKR